jgi:hypothetical protein
MENLLIEMRQIIATYKEMGVVCYELYTLMCAVAFQHKQPYDLNIHAELMRQL